MERDETKKEDKEERMWRAGREGGHDNRRRGDASGGTGKEMRKRGGKYRRCEEVRQRT